MSDQDLEMCPCRIPGTKISRVQCEARQLGNRRYIMMHRSEHPTLSEMFLSCKRPDGSFCTWWLSDEEYIARTTYMPTGWEVAAQEVMNGLV